MKKLIALGMLPLIAALAAPLTVQAGHASDRDHERQDRHERSERNERRDRHERHERRHEPERHAGRHQHRSPSKAHHGHKLSKRERKEIARLERLMRQGWLSRSDLRMLLHRSERRRHAHGHHLDRGYDRRNHHYGPEQRDRHNRISMKF